MASAEPESLFQTPKVVPVCDAQLHSIPCKVHYTGPGPVSSQFKHEELGAKGDVAATFRGRLLVGEVVTPPPPYSIYVTKQLEAAGNGGGPKTYQVESKLNSLYAWDHDEKQHGANGTLLKRSLDFLKIAEDLAADEPTE